LSDAAPAVHAALGLSREFRATSKSGQPALSGVRRGRASTISTGYSSVQERSSRELANPELLFSARHAIVRAMSYELGTTTDRVLSMAYELLDLPAPHWRELPCAKPAASIP
jgi:hypothetical protein